MFHVLYNVLVSVLLGAVVVNAGSVATKTCNVAPLGPGKDDTDQVCSACEVFYVLVNDVACRLRQQSQDADTSEPLSSPRDSTTSRGKSSCGRTLALEV